MPTKIRAVITGHRMHHPRTDIERLSIKKENSERDLIQIELSYWTISLGLKK